MGVATASKLHILAAPDCSCRECTFIRDCYACACPECGRQWQAAFATAALAAQAMADHTRECRAARQRARQRKPGLPQYVATACGWCGVSWPQRFTTRAASQRFLREHARGCYLVQRQQAADTRTNVKA